MSSSFGGAIFMGKELYGKELKLKVVKFVLSGHSHRETAKKFKISTTPIEKWVNAYKIHGERGLESRNTEGHQKEIDGQYRLNVIQYKHEHGLSCTQTAAIFCLDVVTISRWDRKYREEGANAFMNDNKNKTLSPAERKKNKNSSLALENQKLIEENKQLHMENEYLKNLNALIQKRENSQKTIK